MNGIHYTTPERQAQMAKEARKRARIRKVKEAAQAAGIIALMLGMLIIGAWVDGGSPKAIHQAQAQAAASQK